MALIECPECGKQVSSEADSCPNCGWKPKRDKENAKTVVYSEIRRSGNGWRIAFGVLLLILAFVIILLPNNCEGCVLFKTKGTIEFMPK